MGVCSRASRGASPAQGRAKHVRHDLVARVPQAHDQHALAPVSLSPPQHIVKSLPLNVIDNACMAVFARRVARARAGTGIASERGCIPPFAPSYQPAHHKSTRFMQTTRRIVLAVLICALSFAGRPAGAQSWINWNSFVTGNPGGSAAGTIALPGGPLGVTFSGEVGGGSSVASPWWSGFGTTYSSPTAPLDPGNTGFVQMTGPSVQNTLTFASPVNRVFFAIMSLGGGTQATYSFDRAFTLLSQGPGWYGGCNTCLTVSGNTVSGGEGDGVLMFTGPITTLSWDVVGSEYYHGFTVGVDDVVSAAPEPATFALLGSGMLGLVPLIRRRRRSSVVRGLSR